MPRRLGSLFFTDLFTISDHLLWVKHLVLGLYSEIRGSCPTGVRCVRKTHGRSQPELQQPHQQAL